MIRTVSRKGSMIRHVPIRTRSTLRRRQVKALDALWREVIRLRDQGVCQVCESTRSVQAHHIFTRARYAMRWDPDNGVLLCAGHHRAYAHMHPLRFHEWARGHLGQEPYNRLLLRSQVAIKVDLAATKVLLEQTLKALQESSAEASNR